MKIGTGDAPCGNCGKHIYNIPLDLDSRKPDGYDGYWYKVINNAHCLNCGGPLSWYHKPALVLAQLPIRETVDQLTID